MRIRKRRHGRRRNNRKQFIIISVSLFVFVFVLCTAYSAFSTNLSLNASGEVVQANTVSVGGIDVELVSEGDGLYEDSYENGRYAYKGGDVDNYVDIDGEIWRIISVESDGTIKVIKNESIGDMPWDENGSNDWSTATLNTYLNSTYTTTALDYAVSHSWNVGAVSEEYDDGEYIYDLSTTISEEQVTTWTGYVALATVSEYIRADSDETNCGSIGDQWLNVDGSICYDTNWMNELSSTTQSTKTWLLSPDGTYSGYVWDVVYSDILSSGVVEYYDDGVLPVLYLSSSTTFDNSTDGTESNPYKIISSGSGGTPSVITTTSVGGIDVEVVTSGDGLYEDSYESGRYAYKGGDVDNYVDIDGETWRIISVESDGTIKIIKNESLGQMNWDDNNLNDWLTATLNTYLNSSYTTSALDYAVSHSWNVGEVSDVDDDGDLIYDLSQTISEEQVTTWTGYVALATVSEYIRADSDETNCGSIGDNLDNAEEGGLCYDTNWLAPLFLGEEGSIYDWGWLLSPYSKSSTVWTVYGDAVLVYLSGSVGSSNVTIDTGNITLPVLYLSSDIQFDSSTDGSESNPYKIIS